MFIISTTPTPSSLSHPSKMRGRKHSGRKHKVLEKGLSCLKCLTQVKTWKREWESGKKCKIFLGHLKMPKHTGKPAQINGKKKKKSFMVCERQRCHLWIKKSLKWPSLEAVRLCGEEVCLPSGYTFSFMFGFTHSEGKYLWQGGFYWDLVRLCRQIEPFSFFHWKC